MESYSWIIVILVIGINLLFIKGKANNYLFDKPEVKVRANSLYFNIFIFTSIPFLIEGLGIILGFNRYAFDYLLINHINIFIVLWLISVIIIWIKGTHWIFKKNGAKFLAEHPDILFPSPRWFKESVREKMFMILWVIIVVLNIYGIFYAFFGY
jgi:hypothetical protein